MNCRSELVLVEMEPCTNVLIQAVQFMLLNFFSSFPTKAKNDLIRKSL